MDDGTLTNQGKGDVAGFTEVDQATDARFFVEFLDAANALPDVQTLKAVMVDELRLSPGVRVPAAAAHPAIILVGSAAPAVPANRRQTERPPLPGSGDPTPARVEGRPSPGWYRATPRGRHTRRRTR